MVIETGADVQLPNVATTVYTPNVFRSAVVEFVVTGIGKPFLVHDQVISPAFGTTDAVMVVTTIVGFEEGRPGLKRVYGEADKLTTGLALTVSVAAAELTTPQGAVPAIRQRY